MISLLMSHCISLPIPVCVGMLVLNYKIKTKIVNLLYLLVVIFLLKKSEMNIRKMPIPNKALLGVMKVVPMVQIIVLHKNGHFAPVR
jgi:hypothetical protein